VIAISYYIVYEGLVKIKLLPGYGYDIDYNQFAHYGTHEGQFGLFLIALGGVIFALAYMHMEKYHNFKYKIMGSRHCEKTSFLYFAGILGVAYSAFLMVAGRWNYPIEWFYLTIMVALGGWLGVLWYRATNKKKILSIDSLKFWSAKS